MKRGVLDFAILAFLATQILDGVLTYFAIMGYGVGAEGNPIVASMVHLFGPGVGLCYAKLVAAACGVTLYFAGVAKVLLGLTVFYLAAAIVPWSIILSNPAIF